MVTTTADHRGFTLIEMLVVMAIIATLLSFVGPRYFESVVRAKESTLQHDLSVMRDSIDKFYSDTGAYPESLEALVQGRYLRDLPKDPITDSTETWQIIYPPDPNDKGVVFDVHSGALGLAQNGTRYADW